jgi:N-acetyltransferase
MSTAPSFYLTPELTGETLLLRPLQADDFDALYAVAADPQIWALHPQPDRYKRDVFASGFFSSALDNGALAILERNSGRMLGSSRFYEWNPELREVAIGYTFLGRNAWGGTVNAELKQLMLDYAFQWAKRVWLHIGADNLRSRRAAEKIGASLSHIEDKTILGQTIPYAMYVLEKPV